MTTVAILGDTHGSMTSPFNIVLRMQDSEYGIVVGDFGYWPRTDWYRDWINELEERLFIAGKRLWFVDGNHEDFASLNPLLDERHLREDEFGGVKISHRVAWMPRGHRWTWGDKTFLAMGGAPSIDKAYRLMMEGQQKAPRTHWFHEENITFGDIAKAGTDKVDYLITHDGPTNVPMRLFPFGDWSRQMLSNLAMTVQPEQWFHGHYHSFMAYDFPSYGPYTKVWGLDESHSNHWYGTLDLNTGIFSMP